MLVHRELDAMGRRLLPHRNAFAVLLLAAALAACSSQPPPRGALPRDRDAVDRMSNAYVRAVELHNAGDCAGAVKLLERVAAQGSGYEDAQRRLGQCTIALAGGDGPRYREGLVWLKRAAEAGWPEAQGLLAVEYASGPAADPVEAAKWLALYERNPKARRLGFTPVAPARIAAARAGLTPEQIAAGEAAAAAFVPVVWQPPAKTSVEDGGARRAPSAKEPADRPVGGEFPEPGR
jgi:TPR repeat protein